MYATRIDPYRLRGDGEHILYRDTFNCGICNQLVIYMGLDKNRSNFCQSCQDEIAKGKGMSSKFKKMWIKYIERPKLTEVAEQ